MTLVNAGDFTIELPGPWEEAESSYATVLASTQRGELATLICAPRESPRAIDGLEGITQLMQFLAQKQAAFAHHRATTWNVKLRPLGIRAEVLPDKVVTAGLQIVDDPRAGTAVPAAFVYALAGNATHIVSLILERGHAHDPEGFLNDAMRTALTVRFSD